MGTDKGLKKPKQPGLPRIAMVKVKELLVDDRYQRDLDEKRAVKIAREYEEHRFGFLAVSKREDGSMYVIDGQHRLRAAEILGFDLVPCAFYEDMRDKEEAVLFSHIQLDRKGLSQVDRFRAQVFAGDPESVSINEIVSSLGKNINRSRHDGKTISAVISLERIHRKYGAEHLRHTLATSIEIWESDNGSLQGAFLDGLSRWLANWGDHRFDDAVKIRLRSASPMVLMRTASAVRGGGSQMGHLIEAQLQKTAKVRGRPRKFEKPKTLFRSPSN